MNYVENTPTKIKKWPRILLLFTILIISSFLIYLNATYKYPGPITDHFDGSRFINPDAKSHSFQDMLKWLWEMKTTPWPTWIVDTPRPAPPAKIEGNRLRATFINHATILIQVDGLNIITDPIWSDRAGPFSLLGSERIRAPGVIMEDLPKIDYILISHDHYDHLDLPTMENICGRDCPVILTGLGVKDFLRHKGFKKIWELDWWQKFDPDSAGLSFTFVPAQHGSGRWPFREEITLWGGFVIESISGEQVYYAGDTGYGPFLKAIGERFTKIRLAILTIGNYEKRWFMKNQHMNPEDAVQAHKILASRQSIGCHYATFEEHPEQTYDAHEKDLSAALDKYGVPHSQFWILNFGEGRDIPPY